MGGSNSHMQTKNKATSASFSLFGFPKRPRQHQQDDPGGQDDAPGPREDCPSDYDRKHYVADPNINVKASAFIANFHEARAAKSEHHTSNA